MTGSGAAADIIGTAVTGKDPGQVGDGAQDTGIILHEATTGTTDIGGKDLRRYLRTKPLRRNV